MVLPLKECHPLSPEESVQCNNDKGTHNASLRPSLCDSAPSTGQEHCLFRGANKTECLLGWGVRLPCSTPHPLLSSCQVCIQLPCFPLTGCLAKHCSAAPAVAQWATWLWKQSPKCTVHQQAWFTGWKVGTLLKHNSIVPSMHFPIRD